MLNQWLMYHYFVRMITNYMLYYLCYCFELKKTDHLETKMVELDFVIATPPYPTSKLPAYQNFNSWSFQLGHITFLNQVSESHFGIVPK